MAEEEPIETRIKEACLQAAGNARVDHCRMAYVLKMPSDVQVRLYKNKLPQPAAPPIHLPENLEGTLPQNTGQRG